MAVTGRPNRIFLSDDGKRVGWIDQKEVLAGGTKMRVVVSDVAGEYFSIIGNPSFSAEGRVVYGAEQADRSFVVIDATRIETPDRVGDPVFSPDGRKVGYGAQIGRELWWKVIDVPKRD